MKYQSFAVLLLSLSLAACSSKSPTNSNDAIRSVTYRGEVITLSRPYTDFREYKDDPKNLPTGEVPRVAKLVRSAPFPASFASRKEADDTVFGLMFPGYGLSMLQLHEPVALYSIEIPQMEEDRWLVLIEKSGRWVVVDDFVWPTSSGSLNRAEYKDGRLRYLDRTGKVLRER